MGVMLLPTGLRGHPSAQAARRASSGVRRSPTASKMSVGHSRSVSTPDAVGATKTAASVVRRRKAFSSRAGWAPQTSATTGQPIPPAVSA